MSKKEIKCGGIGYGKTFAYISSALKDSPWIRGEVVADRLKWLDEMYNPYFFRNFMVKKKMTKAEAFEWLKGKKVKCYAGITNLNDEPDKVEKFLKDVGCRYHFANHISWRDWYWPLYGFIVDSKGEIYVAFENQMDFFEQNLNEPISIDDILSIEIVENPEDKIVELAKPLMEYLQEQNFTDAIRVNAEGIYLEPMSSILHEI